MLFACCAGLAIFLFGSGALGLVGSSARWVSEGYAVVEVSHARCRGLLRFRLLLIWLRLTSSWIVCLMCAWALAVVRRGELSLESYWRLVTARCNGIGGSLRSGGLQI